MLNPYPASPSRQPKCCLYITHAETNRRWVCPWGALFAAKKIIDHIAQPVRQIDHNNCVVGDFQIRSNELNDILEHEYSTEERSWELPLAEQKKLLQLAGKKPEPNAFAKDNPIQHPKAKPEVKKPEVKKPDGLTSLADICAELKIEPKQARIKLRAAKEPNTHGNWSFSAADIDRIKKIIGAK
jgi:hypothetical protein